MKGINVFYESHTDAFNGYTAIAKLLVSTEQLHSVLETDIEVKGIDEGTFNVRCFDGVALAVNDKMNVVLSYPLKFNLTNENIKECLCYRGLLESVSYIDITFGDIMMRFGEPIMIHHKK